MWLVFRVLAGSRATAHRGAGVGLLFLVAAALLSACGDRPQLTDASEPTIGPTPEPTVPRTAAETPTRTPPTDGPTPAAVATPVPTATPTQEPTAIPTPVPAAYLIEILDTAFVGASDGFVSAEFSISARNVGGSGGPPSMPVEMTIDENEPETVHVIEPPVGGETVSLVVTRKLSPGHHSILFEVGDSKQLIDVDVKTADLALEPIQHTITKDGSIELSLRVTNEGDLSADAVAMSVDWAHRTDDSIGTTSSGPFRIINTLDPGESQVVSLPFEIPSGSYTFKLRAETETIEALQDNNTAETTIEVDYIQLISNVQSTATVGYEGDGDGIVEITLLVTNEGKAPSGPISVGIACRGAAPEGCSQDLSVDSISPGDSIPVILTLTLPQGDTPVIAYAGANDDGYRWGRGNVQESSIHVAHKSAVSLALDAHAGVSGYWSDGTAQVKLTTSIRNEGYSKVEDTQHIAITCQQDGETVTGCGGEIAIDLADGFGPAEATHTLEVPMGSTLELDLRDSDGHEVRQLDVPERILGVDRHVWECFSDRPGIHADEEGCGGWYSKEISKWDQTTPIRIWATGREDYIEVLREAIVELSPLLNLEFEWAESKEQADLEAHMGVAASEAMDAGLDCPHDLGCADWQGYLGVVESATIGVWLDESRWWSDVGLIEKKIRTTTIHEVLHALVPMYHRVHPASIMNIHNSLDWAVLSPMDEALIRLNSHPLVEPGMTMPEVEELIVFADELLDPPSPPEEPGAYEIARRAYVALQEADSASFRMRGAWRGRRCDSKFGWADYEIGGFGRAYANLVHLDDGPDHFYIIGATDDGSDEYWNWEGIRWRQVDFDDVFDDTNWRERFTSPHVMLASILHFADEGDIEVSRPSEGDLKLSVKLGNAYVSLSWSLSEELSAVVVLDEETYQIKQYTMTWHLWPTELRSCSKYEMEAADGEYGLEIKLPDAIVEGSQNLS